LLLLDAFAQLLTATMQMGAHGAYWQLKRLRNLLVAPFFLMVEHQNGPLHRAQLLQLALYRISELPFRKLLLSVEAGVLQAAFPIALVFRKRHQGKVIAATALPFVLGYVGDNAVEVGAEQSFAAKRGECPVEAEKDLLGKVVNVFPAAGEAHESAEDHGLMVSDDLLEAEVGGQGE
jgi:hypothetical protein